MAPLVAAATDEPEPDIAVEMCEAAFELAGPAHIRELRTAVDIMLRIASDENSPRAARRDALEHLHQHIDHAVTAADDDVAALADWWKKGRDRAGWSSATRRLSIPAPPSALAP